jgi:hypothetical protein
MTRAWIGVTDGELDLPHLEHTLLEVGDRLELPVILATSHIVDAGIRQVAGVLTVASLRVDVPRELWAWASAHHGAAFIDDGVSVFAFGRPEARAGAADAVARCKRRAEGRAIRFPGQDDIPGVTTVELLIARTAIDRVEALGSIIGPGDVIETSGFVRPRFVSGELVLHVVPLTAGRFRPFEVEHPHRCCEDPFPLESA